MKRWLNFVIAVLFVASLFFAFGVVNSMVSLKYETNAPGDCVSTVTGTNLCYSLKLNKVGALTSFLLAIGLLTCKVFFVKTRKPPKP